MKVISWFEYTLRYLRLYQSNKFQMGYTDFFHRCQLMTCISFSDIPSAFQVILPQLLIPILMTDKENVI